MDTLVVDYTYRNDQFRDNGTIYNYIANYCLSRATTKTLYRQHQRASLVQEQQCQQHHSRALDDVEDGGGRAGDLLNPSKDNNKTFELVFRDDRNRTKDCSLGGTINNQTQTEDQLSVARADRMAKMSLEDIHQKSN